MLVGYSHKMDTKDRNCTVMEMKVSFDETSTFKVNSTRHSIDFKRLRDVHEKQIEERSRQVTEDIVPMSLRTSNEDDGISIFHF